MHYTRGPKTCNNGNTYESFVHYLKVVDGSDGKEERAQTALTALDTFS